MQPREPRNRPTVQVVLALLGNKKDAWLLWLHLQFTQYGGGVVNFNTNERTEMGFCEKDQPDLTSGSASTQEPVGLI